MKRKIILIVNLIALIVIFQFGCSKKSDSITYSTISIDTFNNLVGDSLTIFPALNFDLTLDKEKYYVGDIVKISFKIIEPTVFDASFVFKVIFPNQEKLGIEVYKDSSLIYNYPIQTVENNPDTLFLPATLYYNWPQVDNDSNQVKDGEYTIKAFLLHERYSKFVKQKRFLIYK